MDTPWWPRDLSESTWTWTPACTSWHPGGGQGSLSRLPREKNLCIDGVFSHLCVSDSPEKGDEDYTQQRLGGFLPGGVLASFLRL